MKKQLLTAGIISVVGLTGTLGVTSASAMSGERLGGENGMIAKIVERFNLEEEEVTGFFEEQRAERDSEREDRQDERLAEAAADGTLTEAQSDLIKEKTHELQAEREANMDSDLTREERRAQMQERRTALQAWAEKNDIPDEFVGQGHRHGGPNAGKGGKLTTTE